MILPLEISGDVQSGTVFAAMHWNAQFLNSGGINEVTIGAVDKRSFQPELKHTAVHIEAIELPWRMQAARRGDVLQIQARVQELLRDCAYASITIEADLLILNAAHNAAGKEVPALWLEKLYAALDLPTGADTLEYRDERRRLAKRVMWHDGALAGFVFSGDKDGANKGADSVLDNLRQGQQWQGSRLAVFTRQTANVVVDRTICLCKQVKASSINQAIAGGATLDKLKATLGCGTVCGSCVPELKQLCEQGKLTSHA